MKLLMGENMPAKATRNVIHAFCHLVKEEKGASSSSSGKGCVSTGEAFFSDIEIRPSVALFPSALMHDSALRVPASSCFWSPMVGFVVNDMCRYFDEERSVSFNESSRAII